LVPAETLSSFLEAESEGLVTLFKNIDNWPWQTGHYPALPDDLSFNGKNDTARSLSRQFTDRARINPKMHFDTLFVQYAPGEAHHFNNPLLEKDIVLDSIISTVPLSNPPLERINPDDLVSPFRIIISAVDEPDYGMDIKLWQNNNTKYGKRYGFGDQPFGNETTPISSQAPFHMGFYFEPFQLYLLNGNLYRTYPEYRIHFFLTLSRYAFKTHHAYWGYRFLGWSIHYLQDLNQPYHSTVAPGILSWRLMSAYVAGGSTLQDFIQILTNKHFVLENYQYYLLSAELEKTNTQNQASQFVQALADNTYDKHRRYNDLYPRNIVALESHRVAAQMDIAIENAFSLYTKPDYIFGTTDPNINLYEKIDSNDKRVAQLNNELIFLFKAMGDHTRTIVLYALDPKNGN
jgi:hypothetical protein